MAVLIPSLGASVSRMTTGERRLAERLLLPVSCGREGPEPMVINLPTCTKRPRRSPSC